MGPAIRVQRCLVSVCSVCCVAVLYSVVGRVMLGVLRVVVCCCYVVVLLLCRRGVLGVRGVGCAVCYRCCECCVLVLCAAVF